MPFVTVHRRGRGIANAAAWGGPIHPPRSACSSALACSSRALTSLPRLRWHSASRWYLSAKNACAAGVSAASRPAVLIQTNTRAVAISIRRLVAESRSTFVIIASLLIIRREPALCKVHRKGLPLAQARQYRALPPHRAEPAAGRWRSTSVSTHANTGWLRSCLDRGRAETGSRSRQRRAKRAKP